MTGRRAAPGAVAGWAAHADGLCAISWSRAGRRIATGGNDGLIRLWGLSGGEGTALTTLAGHRGSVRSLAWAPGDRWLASGAEDGTVRVWDTATGDQVAVAQRGRRWVNAVAWSPDGALVAAAGGDRRIVVTDACGRPAIKPLPSPYGVFLNLAWSPDGGALAAASRAPVLVVWETTGWSVDRHIPAGPGTVWTVCWWSGGLATGNAAGRLTVWGGTSLGPRTTVDGHGGVVARVTVSRTGEYLATLSHDQTIGVWQTDTGRLLWRHEDTYPGWSGCLEASPTDDLLGGPDASGREVRIWPLRGSAADEPLHEQVAECVRRGAADSRTADGYVMVPQLTHLVASRFPQLRKPEGWVQAALQRCGADGEIGYFGDRLAAADPAELDRRASLSIQAAAAAGERVLRLDSGPAAALTGCLLIQSGRAWIETTAEPGRLCAPEALSDKAPDGTAQVDGVETTLSWRHGVRVHPSRVLADVLDTTLFRRWTAWRHGLVAQTGAGAAARVTAERLPPSGLLVRVAAPRDCAIGDLITGLIARRVTREHPDAGAPARHDSDASWVMPAEQRAWDPPATALWALDDEDLPAGLEDRIAVLDEQIDDERARQERLVLDRGFGAQGPVDVHIWHLLQDRDVAARLAAQLAVLGFRAQFGVEGVSRLVTAGGSAKVAALLVTPALRAWTASPLAQAYAELTRTTRAQGRRVRWLPVVVDGAGMPEDLPNHLRSFDWYGYGGGDRAAQRADVQALLGGVLVDRARS